MGIVLIIILVVIVVVLVVYAISTYNGLVRRRNEVEESYRQIDVQLKRRYDLIPNLLEGVKKYFRQEQEVLTQITQARSQAMQPQSPGPGAVGFPGGTVFHGEQDLLREAALQRLGKFLHPKDTELPRRHLRSRH